MDDAADRQLFERIRKVLERPADERLAYAQELCGGDQESLRRLLKGLSADGSIGTLPLTLDDESRSGSPGRPGAVLGDYRLLRQLGQGGMGIVWEAIELSTQRLVALKLLAPPNRPSEEALDRFRREGRLAAAIAHDRCVFVLAAGEFGDVPFIAMDLMRGGQLDDEVRANGPLEPALAVDHALAILEGLEAAAQVGILHRDIKPSNCFLDEDGRVKIGDFGISKSLLSVGDLTRTGQVLATPAYASPEQLRGRDLDARSDQYSLGATLYFLLTGRPPFAKAHGGDLLAAVFSEQPERPSSLRRGVPAGLDRVVMRMLSKEKDRRFPDHESARAALRPYSSQAAAGAPLGRRALAFLIDATLLLGASRAVPYALSRQDWFYPTLWFAYFFVGELLFSRSTGKALIGLSILGRSGRRAEWLACTLRCGAFAALLPGVVALLPSGHDLDDLWAVIGGPILVSTALFRRDRRGLHEILSDTRTIVGRRPLARMPEGFERTLTPRALDESAMRLGPFEVEGLLAANEEAGLLLARDSLLGRSAWIVLRSAASPEVPRLRRELTRRTRPRWLQSGVARDGRRWDAYESCWGCPLPEAAAHDIPWQFAARWLRSILGELEVATDPSTLAAVPPEWVWLRGDGSVCILDLPGLVPETGTHPENVLQEAWDTLVGSRLEDPRAETPWRLLRLRTELAHMAPGSEAVARAGRSLESAAESVGASLRSRRIALLVVPIFMVLLDLRNHDNPIEVATKTFDEAATNRTALTVALGSEYQFDWDPEDLITKPDGTQEWAASSPVAIRRRFLAEHPDLVRAAREIVATTSWESFRTWPGWLLDTEFQPVFNYDLRDGYTSLEAEKIAAWVAEVAEAADTAPPSEADLEADRRGLAEWERTHAMGTLSHNLLGLLRMYALIAVALSFLTRGGPLVRAAGLRVVDGSLHEASRWRAATRTLVAWVPSTLLVWVAHTILPASGAELLYDPWTMGPVSVVPTAALLVLAALLFVAGAIAAIVSPFRGWPERLTGCRLVPS